jgi:hypothetical protein
VQAAGGDAGSVAFARPRAVEYPVDACGPPRGGLISRSVSSANKGVRDDLERSPVESHDGGAAAADNLGLTGDGTSQGGAARPAADAQVGGVCRRRARPVDRRHDVADRERGRARPEAGVAANHGEIGKMVDQRAETGQRRVILFNPFLTTPDREKCSFSKSGGSVKFLTREGGGAWWCGTCDDAAANAQLAAAGGTTSVG